MNRIMRLITPEARAYVPKKYRDDSVPMPQDLAEHRPLASVDDGLHPRDLDEEATNLPVLAARPVHNPLRDVALAIRMLSHQEKTSLAKALRTSVSRLNTWTSLMLEA